VNGAINAVTEKILAGFRVLPIDNDLADAVRKTKKYPQYGHPAHTELATGDGPCRGLFETISHTAGRPHSVHLQPFAGLDEYPSPGPVFIHADSCSGYTEPGQFPEELRSLPLTLEAYGDNRWIIARERPTGNEIETSVERLLNAEGVRYIHIRNTEAGCFIARIERGLPR
jgi:hypothetical protein